ncbi:MAG: metallophosphoesterase family protein [Candidatus Hydrogenedentes bacterium]|nr:metallophosphoesterase family protein [Candidatus Hydrogenedentota bacterium]
MYRRLHLFFSMMIAGLATAQVGTHPTVHDVAAGVTQRLQESLPAEQLLKVSVEQVMPFITEEDWKVLGEKHLSFRINVPATVYVFRDSEDPNVVHWLPARGFVNSGLSVNTDSQAFDGWSKDFEAGVVGLGVPSIDGDAEHYFVVVAPKQKEDALKVTEVTPATHTAGTLVAGERIGVSWNDTKVTEAPEALRGALLLRGDPNKRRSARLTQIFQTTEYPATPTPDHVVLTWGDDPTCTQSIQWRTSTATEKGLVRYRTQGTEPWAEQQAKTLRLENHNTVNDPLSNWHTVCLSGLKPGTKYEYQVGTGTEDGWIAPAMFETAPDKAEPFSFIYLGDAQAGFDEWGELLHQCYRENPEAAFYVMAGDLVNRGNERADWDRLFHNAEGVFDHRPLVPSIGNHEVQGDKGPWMYLELLDLPKNGPKGVTPERAYSFTYGNVLVISLDANVEPAEQTEWLESELKNTKATWKFVTYHQPAYSSGANRDNPEVRELWGALFDKYHVDLALQGHDHAYLRTWPMYNQKRVATAAEGTIYIVSTSGTKYYDQGQFDYTEVGFTNTNTYQVLDIKIDGDTLTYKAHGADGKVLDQFVIEK